MREIKLYKNAPIHQFWYEDGILHLWVNVRSGLYVLPINENEEMHFLADVHHKLSKEQGTVYEFKGIVKVKESNT